MSPSQCALLGLMLMLTLSLKVTTARPDDSTEGPVIESLEEELVEEEPSITNTTGTPAPTTTSPVDSLRQQAEDNANALKRLAEVMHDLVYETSSQRCMGTGGNLQQLTSSIKEGFTILVGAVRDLNNSMSHYKQEISRKALGQGVDEAFVDDGPCPAPFFLAGDDCLYIETEHLRFFDAARQACIDMGAKLAEFDNFDPFVAAVRDMNLHRDAEIYVGATDRDSEGVWRWLSGERVSSIPWGYDEPNNSDDNEHCAAMSPRTRKFNDIPCHYRREFVCERK